jgi:hypothetical protein
MVAKNSEDETALISARRIKPGLPADKIEKQFLP